jgi:hypothetical protein
MNLMNSGIKFNPKLLLVSLLVAAGVSTYVVKIKEAKAAVGLTGLTGKYSCVGNRNFAPMMTYMQNSTGVGANFLWLLDFDAHTHNGVIFTNSNWNQGTVNATTMTATGTFTETAGPISGTYRINSSLTVNDNTTTTNVANIVISNSGNTFFYSTDAGSNKSPETGVCQKQ